jgi:cobalt-zinc-cadmium efflux system membrane fusion protein
MTFRGANAVKLGALVVGVLVLVGIGVAAMPMVRGSIKDWWVQHGPNKAGEAQEPESSAKLVPGMKDTLELPRDVVQKLGIQTAEIHAARQTRPLQLTGSLNFDPDHLAPVRARFAGEVVEIGQVEAPPENATNFHTEHRLVRYGDRVTKGQLLAVVWSSDLGKAKGDLVAALTQLKLDEAGLRRMQPLYEKGDLSEAAIQAQEQRVASDRNTAGTAENALRTWRVPEEEIQAVKDEAERIFREGGKRNLERQRNWARVEVRAPLDGIIVEKTVVLHNLVDTSTDLFKVADLKWLTVWAHAFEEDLPALQALTPDQRHWEVRLQAEPRSKPLPGRIAVIGPVIDPNQHTAQVMGYVHNQAETLKVGQFVTATVQLPPPPGQVAVPTSALDEDGETSVVFVQEDPSKPRFTRKLVDVTQRGEQFVLVRARLSAADKKEGRSPLRPGERVVTAGVVELEAALEDAVNGAKKE